MSHYLQLRNRRLGRVRRGFELGNLGSGRDLMGGRKIDRKRKIDAYREWKDKTGRETE